MLLLSLLLYTTDGTIQTSRVLMHHVKSIMIWQQILKVGLSDSGKITITIDSCKPFTIHDTITINCIESRNYDDNVYIHNN